MTASQLYDPVFQLVCDTSRVVRGDASFRVNELRRRADRLFNQIEETAKKDTQGFAHFQKLHVPMKYFIDSMMARSILSSPESEEWHENRLGYEDSRDGDQAFFEHLETLLKADASPEVSEQLVVFYTCLGLGFKGVETPENIESIKNRIVPRINQALSMESGNKLSPASYQGLDDRDLVKPPQEKKLAAIAAVLCLLLASVALYDAIYHRFAAQIPTEVRQILGSSQDVAPWAQRELGSNNEEVESQE